MTMQPEMHTVEASADDMEGFHIALCGSCSGFTLRHRCGGYRPIHDPTLTGILMEAMIHIKQGCPPVHEAEALLKDGRNHG